MHSPEFLAIAIGLLFACRCVALPTFARILPLKSPHPPSESTADDIGDISKVACRHNMPLIKVNTIAEINKFRAAVGPYTIKYNLVYRLRRRRDVSINHLAPDISSILR